MDEKEVQNKMQAAVDHLNELLSTIRTGRANAGLVENLSVTHYEQQMPLKALANITTPDGKTITISPWDPNAINSIEKAIREDTKLGLTPLNDGKNVHINVPPLTTERRQQFVKQVGEMRESANVSLRNIRHEALKSCQNQLKDKQISEDEFDKAKQKLDKLVSEFSDQADQIAEQKKQDILSV